LSTSEYKYGGAKTLVALHAQHLREFWELWKRADQADLALPKTSDPSYASREVLLVHVMRCAASYLEWMCERLGVPCPDTGGMPEAEGFGQRAAEYMEQVLAAWEIPLRSMTEEQADGQAYPSKWGPVYTLDAMLEHAVMHPIRHSYQLQRLMHSRKE